MNQPYKVLARRYRPTRLSDLVGQDVLRNTLTEAFQNNRLPHAILLHGIRGVGKTTTARIIARTLNCTGRSLDSHNIEPCGTCDSCLDIQNDRHLDVVEMDAASRTSVDDIREIIESARYKAVKGRFKIFIIDEVHMLSKSAFNALLKTLEEPPAHVKFIFATTEIRKIPDTILSRCMRFDLKRIEPDVVISHLKDICQKEEIFIEDDALSVLARAGDGSMRDSLSLLDQAIALSGGVEIQKSHPIDADLIRKMLGVCDRGKIFSIVRAVFAGNIEEIFKLTDDVFHEGVDPLLFANDILECLYWLICLKTVPHLKNDKTWPKADREEGLSICESLPISSLLRAWQVLSKGYEDIQKNPLPKKALQMVLIQFCHLAQLPPIEKIIESLKGGSGGLPQGGQSLSSEKTTHTVRLSEQAKEAYQPPKTFDELVSFLRESKELILYSHLQEDVRLVEYKPFTIHLSLDSQKFANLPQTLRQTLKRLTQTDWVIQVTTEQRGISLAEKKQEEILKSIEEGKQHPFIKELLSTFPETTLTLMENKHA